MAAASVGRMRAVRGVVHHYAWGDPAFLPQLLGDGADGRPWAELWLGTHPGGPATLESGHSLTAVAGELPYLLKVLAAAEPLSLQTHPDARQAAKGYDREDARGIPLHSPHRIYRDRSAKPELLCALTPFDALCGFRPVDATLRLLDWLDAHEMAAFLRLHGLGATVTALYLRHLDTAPVIAACEGHSSVEAQLVGELEARYPGDPSVAVTLLLNRVTLQPGEAIYLGPGNLHAYLRGAGVEVMGASDNVVRGGLTRKHMDVEELLAVLRIEPLADPVVRPLEVQRGRWRYPTPTAPFELWRFDTAADEVLHHTAAARELLLCTNGDADSLAQGHAAYLAPGETIRLEGVSTVFLVTEARS